MSWSEKSKWIWLQEEQVADSYGDFFSEFVYTSGNIAIQLSADSNYALYINGRFVNSGQYGDYPHYKVYDKIDITGYCKPGTNQLAITVWYYGTTGGSTYYKGNAALRFEIYQDSNLCACSDSSILSRRSINYISQNKLITPQLGLTFFYDATKPELWRTGADSSFAESREISQNLPLYERPNKKYDILPRIPSKLVKQSEHDWIFDLGREEVGYLTLRVKSPEKQKITVAFGEHLTDGNVRWLNNGRDFSVSILVDEGITEYANYFRRLGLRYLEIISEEDLEIEFASVLPCIYPLQYVKREFQDTTIQRIYDTAVRTLELCMHEHYEDCPWREQALYALDSRNQIVCGYYAFGEYQFPRASLLLLSKSLREDGLLNICAPSDLELTIPSFSLHYFTEVLEYTEYSGDKTLALEVLPVLQTILETFRSRMVNGLASKFDGKEYWNFYEWTEGMADEDHTAVGFDAALNCLLSLSLRNMQKICDVLGVPADYAEQAKILNHRIREVFLQKEEGFFANNAEGCGRSELVNSLAILCGAATANEADAICEALTGAGVMTESSLSTRCFKYDALLLQDKKTYSPYILSDIVRRYTKMLDAGATSFWETELGEADFWGAGSLCHGWSAMPVYYFSILLSDDNKEDENI